MPWLNNDVEAAENIAYRKSLELLLEHTRKVQNAVRELMLATTSFVSGKADKVKEHYQKVSAIEEEADSIKLELLDQLTRSAPSFLYREDFLRLVTTVDEIAELAQSAIRLMSKILEKKWLPKPEVGAKLTQLSEALYASYEKLRNAIFAIASDPRRALRLVVDVHISESEIDELYGDADISLLENCTSLPVILTTRDLIHLFETIADLIEDASDDARVLALHRVA